MGLNVPLTEVMSQVPRERGWGDRHRWFGWFGQAASCLAATARDDLCRWLTLVRGATAWLDSDHLAPGMAPRAYSNCSIYLFNLVGRTGFEPVTSSVSGKRSPAELTALSASPRCYQSWNVSARRRRHRTSAPGPGGLARWRPLHHLGRTGRKARVRKPHDPLPLLTVRIIPNGPGSCPG